MLLLAAALLVTLPALSSAGSVEMSTPGVGATGWFGWWSGTYTWTWWFPNRPLITPTWGAPVTVANAAVPTTTVPSLATCSGVTTRGLAVAGSCSCALSATPAGTVEVFVSRPVNVPAGAATPINTCGLTTGRVCNAWECVCSAGTAADLASTTAQVYCT